MCKGVLFIQTNKQGLVYGLFLNHADVTTLIYEW